MLLWRIFVMIRKLLNGDIARALASLATAKADAADAQVAQLKTAIDSQQLADAIAAEA